MPSYSIGQAAGLRVSPETVRRWAESGSDRRRRPPRRVRAHCCGTSSPAPASSSTPAAARTAAYLLAVSGGDGRHTVLYWAELDDDLCGSPVLLATRLDGKDLDGPGSQLVVPSDRCGGRYVSTVTHVRFGTLDVPALIGG